MTSNGIPHIKENNKIIHTEVAAVFGLKFIRFGLTLMKKSCITFIAPRIKPTNYSSSFQRIRSRFLSRISNSTFIALLFHINAQSKIQIAEIKLSLAHSIWLARA